MGSHRIVVQAPGFDDLARVRHAKEPVLVKTLVAKPAAEALDIGILIWLAGLDELKPDALGGGPRRVPGRRIRDHCRDEHRRLPAGLDQPFEDLDNPRPPSEVSTSIAKQARVKSSTTASSRTRRPSSDMLAPVVISLLSAIIVNWKAHDLSTDCVLWLG